MRRFTDAEVKHVRDSGHATWPLLMLSVQDLALGGELARRTIREHAAANADARVVLDALCMSADADRPRFICENAARLADCCAA